MKVLLTTLSAKYVHTTLALRYLKTYVENEFEDVFIEEYTINNNMDYILGEIYKKKYDIVCFSCYIWNIEKTLILCKNLKKVNPNLIIALGGPEVSFDPERVMSQNPSVDYVMFGEGEETFKEFLEKQNKGEVFKHVAGIAYKEDGKIYVNEERPLIGNLDSIPSPYDDDLSEYENKIIYYESSRGCPYNCSYCLSSTIRGVRFFSMDRVKRDLGIFLKNRVRQVKFVDRTFNANKKHSLHIMKFLKENDNGHTNFHFEITADLIDEETMEFLKDVREGLFQFEIGVQSTNDATIKEIDRNVNFEKLSKVVKRVSEFKNTHLHLDLIAGLPFETYDIFKKSFDDVYNLRPEQLQLGFLKLLKGSSIRVNEEKHGYVYKDEAPYEILKNDYMSYEDILKLKDLEEMVEIYYNSGGLRHSVEYIVKNFYTSPFKLYEDLAQYWQENGLFHVSHNKQKIYKILLDFYNEKIKEKADLFEDLLKFDYMSQHKGSLPNFFKRITIDNMNVRIHDFLHDEENIRKYLSQYENVLAKNILKKIEIVNFNYDILLFINKGYDKDIEESITTILFDYDKKTKVFHKSIYYKIQL
ncbi:B12-binding domain-containing radical SAM protein [Anaeromicrobium sediminis]|uniref:B12-binding domain-containing radical SAM protein n=1 Tax=Anaeromicrobium sediminis TaxID=1478221 RepID=A0A267MKH6_9FIRM|nr:B12-binding domain-containing radical SAM protein [Anaeromicrobium sediminis]PAB59418.1 B12-binding domain-containing radical SAM protein [Anaeromicrobium sediminis]